MKRSKCLGVLLAILMILCIPLAVFASDDVVTESIGNLTYEIPSDWIVLSRDEDDGTIMHKIIAGQGVMVVTYMPVDLDSSAVSYDLQKLFVDTAVNSYKDGFDDYTELTNEDCLFEDYAANVRSFSYDSDGETMVVMCSTMYTGEGVAIFQLGGTQAVVLGSTDITDQFAALGNSIKTAGTEGSVNSADQANPVSNSGSAADYTKYDAGMYKVGSDIPAGEYVVFATGGMGYFCVSSDSNQNDILFNENFDYNSIITIKDGEYLDLTRCYAVPAEENPDIEVNTTGMFKVGTHIPAGEYKLESSGGTGYYCIYSDSRQGDIIANDNFEGQNYVTVSDGQYLVLVRCKFTEPPAKPMKTYTDSDTIKKVQEALNAAGYDCGTPDGVSGSGTKAAIEKYQTDQALTVTGTITDELLKALGV